MARHFYATEQKSLSFVVNFLFNSLLPKAHINNNNNNSSSKQATANKRGDECRQL